jgi:hypothetical protein
MISKNDRQFTHPNFGTEVRVEVVDNEVALVFVASSPDKAGHFADYLLEQLKSGAINITLMGKPTGIVES